MGTKQMIEATERDEARAQVAQLSAENERLREAIAEALTAAMYPLTVTQILMRALETDGDQ